MNLTIEQQQALGLDGSALCEWQQGNKTFLLHAAVIEPLRLLQQDAKAAGYNLQIVSAYRDFQRQLGIWNAKASGKRPLLDDNGAPLNFDKLTNAEKVKAIMRWSAVPGLSRHHWGTDFDIFDANQIAIDDVQLIPEEVEGNAPCAAMHRWLSERILQNNSYGFYRPYQWDDGGIAPEMWHLSYLPASKAYLGDLSREDLPELWQIHGLLLREELIANLTSVWSKYVRLSLAGQPDWVLNQLK